MTPERWAEIEELFHRALECEANARERMLEAGAADAELRREVEALLSSHEKASARLRLAVRGEVGAMGESAAGAAASSDSTAPMVEANLTAYAQHQVAERYDVQSEVGRGGMGVVYKAHDRLTGELVALKFLNPDIALEESAVERFKDELRLARRITHKNVCRTHEFLLFGQTAVIVMEYVEGDSLRQILRLFHGVSLRCGREWTKQICEALGEAHAQGIVHRDLKPENVLITRDGRAKVMDFGIARCLKNVATDVGIVSGTPGYMSPEQAEGKPTDARSDIYSRRADRL